MEPLLDGFTTNTTRTVRTGVPSTVTYVYSGPKFALAQTVRDDKLPRNIAQNIKSTTPRPNAPPVY